MSTLTDQTSLIRWVFVPSTSNYIYAHLKAENAKSTLCATDISVYEVEVPHVNVAGKKCPSYVFALLSRNQMYSYIKD